MFKIKTRLGNILDFKDRISKDLTSGIIYKLQCRVCNESYYGEHVRNLNKKIGGNIDIWPLTKKQVKLKNSSAADLSLFCNYSSSNDDFSAWEQKNFTRTEREPVNNKR